MNAALVVVFAALLLCIVPPALATTSREYYGYDDVLLLINSNSTKSVEIGSYFAAQRNVTHILYLDTEPDENIFFTQFNSTIVQPIKRYLAANDTDKKLNYIVTTKGIPLRVLKDGQGLSWIGTSQRSLDSLLAIAFDKLNSSLTSDLAGVVGSTYQTEAVFSRAVHGIFLVTRLDAYTVEQAKTLVDKSMQAERSGVFVIDEGATKWSDQGSDVLKSVVVGNGFGYYNYSAANLFLSNYTNVIGYYSWGDNDNGFHTGGTLLVNNHFTTNLSWTNESGMCWMNGTTTTPASSSVLIINSTGFNVINQNVTPIAGRRYYLYASFSCTNLTGGSNMWFSYKAFSGSGNLVGEFRTMMFNGTYSSWKSLQSSAMPGGAWFQYDPVAGAETLEVSVVANLTGANQSAYVDSAYLYEIKPTMSWRNGSIASMGVSTSARTFDMDVGPASFLDNRQLRLGDVIENGVTGAIGFTNEPQSNAIAYPATLFDRYSKGYSLADSSYMSMIYIAWMGVVVGDPKTHINTLCFDCGSACVLKCANGHDCMMDADCAGSYCNPGSICSTPSCEDGWQNQGEIGVDCGGPCQPCPECSDGQQRDCPVHEGVCLGSRESCTGGFWPGCSPSTYRFNNPSYEDVSEMTCDDGLDNNCANGVDCADADCNGKMCSENGICISGSCRITAPPGVSTPGFELGLFGVVAVSASVIFLSRKR